MDLRELDSLPQVYIRISTGRVKAGFSLGLAEGRSKPAQGARPQETPGEFSLAVQPEQPGYQAGLRFRLLASIWGSGQDASCRRSAVLVPAAEFLRAGAGWEARWELACWGCAPRLPGRQHAC